MFKTPLLLLFLFIGLSLPAQSYFQQEVDHRIDVVLDDEKHYLEGGSTISYTNNSPDTLTKLLFHLWPNAYKDNTTALARQLLRNGRTRFQFAPDEQRGRYERIGFQIDERPLEYFSWEGHPDVVQVQLLEPVLPGRQVEIKTAFSLKIPASFSRLGHVGQAYQMTQWYPKPAVYDRDGWHPMPYLDNGEFYSEFGDFEVNITLPANYLVAATGVLQTGTEQAFLQNKIQATNQLLSQSFLDTIRSRTPLSSPEQKTLQFKAKRVHDFAWFADKDFLVQKSSVQIPNGEEVDTWAYFTPEEAAKWKYATDYLDRSVLFYSKEVGDYPYPHATAVLNTGSAGVGMEYPMITLIGMEWSDLALDEVITHEVGHNWFYGILGFNERDEGWLDEGLNTYYEQRYMTQFYGGQANGNISADPLLPQSALSSAQIIHLYQVHIGKDQPIATTSNALSSTNYWLNYYDLPQLWWAYLGDYLGQDVFDKMMQAFYAEWQFKHPTGKDVQGFFESYTKKDLSWLFDDLFRKNGKIDYALRLADAKGDQLRLVLENKGQVAAPIPLTLTDSEEKLSTEWIEGFEKQKQLVFPKKDYQYLQLDGNYLGLDVKRRNDQIRPGKLFPRWEPLQLQLFPALENAQRRSISISPILAWNNYDKLMPGVVMTNWTFPGPSFTWLVNPMYGLGSQTVVGHALLSYRKGFDQGIIQSLELGVMGRSFHYLRRYEQDYQLAYDKIEPQLKIGFRSDPLKEERSVLSFRSNFLRQQTAQFNAEGQVVDTEVAKLDFYHLRYDYQNFRAYNPVQWKVELSNSRFNNPFDVASYWQLSSTYTTRWMYKSRKNIDLRLYGGVLLAASKDPGINILPQAFDATVQGGNDFAFDHYFFGRSDRYGFWNRQVVIEEGGFKNAFGPGQRLGRSNDYLFAINLMADLPMDLPLDIPIRPYLDLGYLDTGGNNPNLSADDPFLLSAGFALDIWHNRLAIYFPMVHSQNIRDQFAGMGGFGRRISFTMNLGGLTMEDFVQQAF